MKNHAMRNMKYNLRALIILTDLPAPIVSVIRSLKRYFVAPCAGVKPTQTQDQWDDKEIAYGET